jgi:hypothetical protein
VPLQPRQYVRPAKLAERALEEERRRTKVIPHRWAEASWVQLVVAVLLRVSERWGKKQYRECEQHQMRALRQALGLDQPPEAPSLITMTAQPRRSAAAARSLLQEKKDLTPIHGVGVPIERAGAIRLLVDGRAETGPEARLPPALKTAGAGAPGARALWQIAPGGAGAEEPQDTVEEVSVVSGRAACVWLWRGEHRFGLGPAAPLPAAAAAGRSAS